ncbi:MAG: hypothetical protein KDI65_08580 [Alphaproteobacteria bacterium]|nr:hypothetical protein [Alphaproteobacteria bacterium]
MRHMGGLMDQWVRSVQVSDTELDSVPSEEHPFGTPAESIGTLKRTAEFEKRVTRAQPENMVIKSYGQDGVLIPGGYDHLSEALELMIADQMVVNPLFRHAKVELTFRQNPTPQEPTRVVHADPSRTDNAVVEDYVYFLSNKQGTIAQAQYVRDPDGTLNKMKPEAMVEEGLMRQAGPFEVLRGRQSTRHTQGAAIYEGGRTFVRLIVTHPDADYFRSLPLAEQATLPEEFRDRLGIVIPSREHGLH